MVDQTPDRANCRRCYRMLLFPIRIKWYNVHAKVNGVMNNTAARICIRDLKFEKQEGLYLMLLVCNYEQMNFQLVLLID